VLAPCSKIPDSGLGFEGTRAPRGRLDQTVVGGQQHVRTRRPDGGQVEGVEQTVTSGTEVSGTLSDHVVDFNGVSSELGSERA